MILITGAGGLVGSHLAFEAARQGMPVRCLVRGDEPRAWVRRIFLHLDPAAGSALYAQLAWSEGDVLDPEALATAMAGCHTVMHAAGVVSYHRKDRAWMYRVNVAGTTCALEVASQLGVTRFAHVSSIAALGRPASGDVVRESDPWRSALPHTHYALSKHLAEMEVFRAIEEGLNAFVVNPGVVLGAGEPGRSSNALVTLLDRGLPFYSEGQSGFTGASDLARFSIALLSGAQTGERYTCVGANLSYATLCRLICHALERRAPQRHAPGWLLHLAIAGHWLREVFTGKKADITAESVFNTGLQVSYDNTKIQRATGLAFAPIEEAIEEAALFHRRVARGLLQ